MWHGPWLVIASPFWISLFEKFVELSTSSAGNRSWPARAMARVHAAVTAALMLLAVRTIPASARLNVDLPAGILSKSKLGQQQAAPNRLGAVAASACRGDSMPSDLYTPQGGSTAYGGPQNEADGSIRFSGER